MRLTISIILLFFVGAMISTSYGALTTPAGLDGGGLFGRLVGSLPPEAAFAAPVLPALAVMTAFGVLRFVAGAIRIAGAVMVVGAIGLTGFNAEFRSLVRDVDLSFVQQYLPALQSLAPVATETARPARERSADRLLLPPTQPAGRRLASAPAVTARERIEPDGFDWRAIARGDDGPASPSVHAGVREAGEIAANDSDASGASDAGDTTVWSSDPIADLLARYN